MTREITHIKALMAALESMGKDPLNIGNIQPIPEVVNNYFNASTGTGDEGETGPAPHSAAWQVAQVLGPAGSRIFDPQAPQKTNDLPAGSRRYSRLGNLRHHYGASGQ